MADFPLVFNIQGDYGYKVLVVDEEDSIATVIEKAADAIVGVLVAPFPDGTVLKARVHGSEAPLADSLTVAQAGLPQMEALDIYVAG